MVWSMYDWSKVRGPDAKNDEDMSDVKIVAGFITAPGLTVLEDPPKAAKPEVTKEEKEKWGLGETKASPRAYAVWQRKQAIAQARLAELTQGFDDSVETRKATTCADMRKHTEAVLAHPKGGESALAFMCETHAECAPGTADTVNRRNRDKSRMKIRERDTDSETKAIRTLLGLEGSTEVSYPSWMRTFRNDNRVRLDKHGEGLRDEHGAAKPGIWRLVLSNILAKGSPAKRLEMWKTTCENVWAAMGLSGRPTRGAISIIDGRVGVGLYTSLTTSNHNPIPQGTPGLRAEDRYHPNRSDYTAKLVDQFKADATVGKAARWVTKALPKGYFGPTHRARVLWPTVCRMTEATLIERDGRAKLENRIKSLKDSIRLTDQTMGNLDVRDWPEKKRKAMREMCSRLVKAERKRGRANLWEWRIGPNVNGYNQAACRVLLTAAAVMSGLEQGKIEFDRSEATSDEIDQYERAARLAKDPDAFCSFAVATRHPDHATGARAAMALRDAFYFHPMELG